MSAAPRVALLTAAVARSVDDDLAPLLAALADAGVAAAAVDWDDPVADWAVFDGVVIRSSWDYSARLAEYLERLGDIDARTTLHNPLDLVRWNTDKRYLADLAAAGTAVLPTAFAAPGEPLELPTGREFVVKPSVSAGSRDTGRFAADDATSARALAEHIWTSGRTVMVQPYLASVDRRGETAMLFFDGVLSHAIRKGPLLEAGAPPTRALFAPEHITTTTPNDAELALAGKVLDVVAARSDGRPPLYARVDVVEDDGGEPVVLEVELNEPSVFLAQGEGSAARFAAAIRGRLD